MSVHGWNGATKLVIWGGQIVGIFRKTSENEMIFFFLFLLNVDSITLELSNLCQQDHLGREMSLNEQNDWNVNACVFVFLLSSEHQEQEQ